MHRFSLMTVMTLALWVLWGCGDDDWELPGGPDRANSIVVADPLEVEADGVAEAVVIVMVLDSQGEPLEGVEVVLETDRGDGDELTQPSRTDGQGLAEGALRSTEVGRSTVLAWADGTLLDMRVAVTFIEP